MQLLKQLNSILESKSKKDSSLWKGGMTSGMDEQDWMNAVKRFYGQDIKFRSRVEDGKHLIWAEMPGEDRCYGVWNMDDEEGEVLGEGKVY